MEHGPSAGAYSKLRRAEHHLAHFKEETESFLEAIPPAVTEIVEDGGARHVFRLETTPAIPGHWSGLVGDVLHNLRSALDNLAWELVILSGHEPDRRTHFRIAG